MKFVLKRLLPYLINFKTTIIGIGMVAGGVAGIATQLTGATEGQPLTLEGLQLEISSIVVGFGLIFARDADKSSQDSGVRK